MLDDLKKEVLRIACQAEEYGLCHHGGGNFSMMDRNENLIAITPHAECRFDLSYEDILLIDPDGNIVENIGGLHPSSETIVHTSVLKARPDINAVCHTHAKNAATFAVLNREIKPVLLEALFYGGVCRVAPFQLPGTPELAKSVVDGLAGTHAVILQKHGLLTVGKSIYDAYLKSIYVEEVGEINLKIANIVGYENIDQIPYDQVDYLLKNMGMRA
ncbi:MAG TPA: class II aldolase/adducin family protein [Anaerovoracaceae bacterium]|nr:class II aldolase/adducin family protein [Anaerovoracaceae bacterium]